MDYIFYNIEIRKKYLFIKFEYNLELILILNIIYF